jgi:hypothetical protein
VKIREGTETESANISFTGNQDMELRRVQTWEKSVHLMLWLAMSQLRDITAKMKTGTTLKIGTG